MIYLSNLFICGLIPDLRPYSTDVGHSYTRDLKDVEFHLLDTGHFALEEHGEAIARLVRRFLDTRLQLEQGASKLRR